MGWREVLVVETARAGPPHGGMDVLVAEPRGVPRAAVVLLHGRGASPEDILELADAFDVDGLVALAPRAHGGTWYPQRFLAPLEANEPGLLSAHQVIEAIVMALADAGLATERVALGGFSQGACLALDHGARHPRRYGALLGFTGGLIGPPGTRFPSEGSLAGTPVFIGANDPDPHVPWWRVEESARHLEALGGAVELRRYPGRPHAVVPDEIDRARELLTALVAP